MSGSPRSVSIDEDLKLKRKEDEEREGRNIDIYTGRQRCVALRFQGAGLQVVTSVAISSKSGQMNVFHQGEDDH